MSFAAAIVLVGATVAQQVPAPPPWAYGFATAPGAPPAAGAPAGAARGAGRAGGGAGGGQDTTARTVAGSTLSFTAAQVRDQDGPADWFPGDHPVMPEIVARGRRDAQIIACSLCHYPNGKGRPENAGISGLPYSYFVETMMEFKNDGRSSADTRKANPRSGFIAYVPKGSLKKGEALAMRGQCALCHGANLAGIGPIPGIAGRSPSYMVRQMYDMQQGTRKGLWTELMKTAVAQLSADDMLNIAAYVASKTP